MELIPAILVQNEAAFRERVALVEGAVSTVHLDVMDGAFVPNRSWFDASVLRGLAGAVVFELHLMVKDPARHIDETCDLEKVARMIWHVEAECHHAALIKRCHAFGKEAGLAINPRTPTEALTPYAATLDEILVMGADPGFSGRRLDTTMIERARKLHARWPSVPLGFDIGVNAETIPPLRDAGVSRFCVGSAIYGATDSQEALRRLQALL